MIFTENVFSTRKQIHLFFLTRLFILKLQEEVDTCKSTYDALNSQLLEELPQFLEIGSDIYVVAIKEFILNRRLIVGMITQELLSLMDVSNFDCRRLCALTI